MTKTEYRNWRINASLTQEQLAQRLGIDVRTVRARETGENPISLEAEIALMHVTSVRYVSGALRCVRAVPQSKRRRSRGRRVETCPA